VLVAAGTAGRLFCALTGTGEAEGVPLNAGTAGGERGPSTLPMAKGPTISTLAEL